MMIHHRLLAPFVHLRRWLSVALGEFSWRPPAWFRRSTLRSRRFVRAHRLLTTAIVLSVAAFSIGGWRLYSNYKNRPQPHRVAVLAEAPGVTPLEKILVPRPLTIVFSEPVAKLQDANFSLGHERGLARVADSRRSVTSGIQLDPPIAGTWRWATDSRLEFRPAQDWPAGKHFRVLIARAAIDAHALLDHYEVDFATPNFNAEIKDLQFYQDPKQPAIRQVVATFQFSHPVTAEALEKSITLSMIGGADVFSKNKEPRQFFLKAGLHNRMMYLRTVPIALPEREDFLRVTLRKGLTTAAGEASTKAEVESKVRIPDVFSFFRITSAETNIVRTDDGEPEQVLVVHTSAAAKPEDIAKELHAFILPRDKPTAHSRPQRHHHWESAREVDELALAEATPLALTPVPCAQETSQVHAWKFRCEDERALYVKINKGVRATGDFLLGADWDTVVQAPPFPQEIEIQGQGGVLALGGERKLSIKSRGIAAIEYQISRVPADQINHLVSQTSGEFQNPEFENHRFSEENIARIATEKQSIAMENKARANYSTFDFGRYLSAPSERPLQGLFFLKAREWQPSKEKSEDDDDEDENEQSEALAERFVLVTDIAMIVKENVDGSRDVFVASIKTGQPTIGVRIDVLSKNGDALLTAQSDAEGRATFPALGKPGHEKTPVAFVARLGDDVAFMPFKRADRKLDFSRFDTGGIESVSGAELNAFVFTERGVYRPKDEIHVGVIIKRRDWSGGLEGVPVEVEVLDARGLRVQTKKIALPASGFFETSYATASESPTGVYIFNTYLVRRNERDVLLGSTSVHVKEFLPDRMKIDSRLSKKSSGWVPPENIEATIALRNLYGTPASGRTIKARMELAPAGFGFAPYRDYTFFDRQGEENHHPREQTIELGDRTTDENGGTTFELGLERFADATYALTFYAEGFEAEGGRSVLAENSLLVSSLPYVVGFKSDGDLRYVSAQTSRVVEFIAVNPALTKIAVQSLQLKLIEQSYVSALTKQENGNYAYESVLKERVVSTEPVTIPESGFQYALPATAPGNFVIELVDDSGRRVSKLRFSVVGRGAVSRSLEKNAELQLRLSKSSYCTGEQVELNITAPYTGSGLITIERDRVYTHKWFTTDQTNSVQQIALPDHFEGTGYVNVSFIRGLDSKEILASPLSYAIAPFTANIDQRRLAIDLHVPERARPGEPLPIKFKTDRPSKIAIFAVDEGILQVTGFTTPDPLAHFFEKAALMVQTSQIVDLILPEFSILRNTAAFGGDGEGRLNPFKRVTEKPVVFWSGIIDADANSREIVYDVPDYFSGNLVVMAVAVSPDAAGSTETRSLVRGPFVITPGVPTVAAPNDQFEVGVTIANGVTGSGENAEVKVSAETSEHLEVLYAPPQPMHIPENSEATVVFTFRAKDVLGSGTVTFTANTGSETAHRRSTISVRPPTPFMTEVRGGTFTTGHVQIPITRALYPQFRKGEAVESALPLGLAHGLDRYLKNYPNGCSEQITSGAFCRLLLSDEIDFGLDRAEISAQLERTFSILARRQNDQGAFGYWSPEQRAGIDFLSVYVTHFLVEAKAAGFAPPAELLRVALLNLQHMAVLDPSNLADARTIAYAIYVLTREEVITTNYILNLRDWLDRHEAKRWPGDLTTVYLAGALQMLQKKDEAEKLMKTYQAGVHDPRERCDFYQPLGADSQYFAIAARHFPELLKKLTPAQFETIVKPIGDGNFNTLSAAYAVQALKSYSHAVAQSPPFLQIDQIGGDGRAMPLAAQNGLLQRADFSDGAAALRFSTREGLRGGLGTFYQTVEAGFDRRVPNQAHSDGLEVYRELIDTSGKVTTAAVLGEPLTVRLRVRSLKRESVTNVAIVDLLPGAFETVALSPGAGSCGADYVDVREDRVVFFATIGTRAREFVYHIKATNRGEFMVPPPFAESMYERGIKARGLAAKIIVSDAH